MRPMMSQPRPSAGMIRTSSLPSKALITESLGINGPANVLMRLLIGVAQNMRLQRPGGWSLHSALSYVKKSRGFSEVVTAKRSGTSSLLQWREEAWSWSGEAARLCCRVSRVVVLSNDGTAEQGVARTCSLSNQSSIASNSRLQIRLYGTFETSLEYTWSYLKKWQQ